MLKKFTNKKENGFTLAELLIVVAIIAVLVAIAIPIFTSQLEKSRQSTDLANIRAAYAEASANALQSDSNGTAYSEKMQANGGNFSQLSEAVIAGKDLQRTDKINYSKNQYILVTVDSNGNVTFTAQDSKS